MIATLTITLGWWMIPLLLTVAYMAWAVRFERENRGMLAGLSYHFVAIPVLAAWCAYLLLRLLLR